MPKDRKEYFKAWKAANKELRNQQKKRYRIKYADKIREQKRLARQKPKNRLDHAISREINKHLKLNNISKSNRRWQDLVGYTKEQLMEHLQSKFTPEMSWDNYGTYWHIDHIRPKSWYEYKSTDDVSFKECWSLNNLQPLPATINITKCNKYEG